MLSESYPGNVITKKGLEVMRQNVDRGIEERIQRYGQIIDELIEGLPDTDLPSKDYFILFFL